MHTIFTRTIKEVANKYFARNCSFEALHSWGAWALCYNWIDAPDDLTKGDIIAFVERLDRSPYPALAVCTVLDMSDGYCSLMVISHDARNAPPPETIITRSLKDLFNAPLKRRPRHTLSPNTSQPILPYFRPGGKT